MRLKRNSLLVLTLGFALSAPVSAAEPEPERLAGSLPEPQVLFGGVVTENDVGLLFAQLRASLLAAAEGREAPRSELLDRRLDAIGNEFRLRGIFAGLALSHAAEQAVRDAVRDMNRRHADD